MGLADLTVTRFPNGVVNRSETDLFASMRQEDPTRYHGYFEDFDYYVAANYTVTNTGAPTRALANADGGVLSIALSAADDDASFSQKVGTNFLMEAGKPTFFRTRFNISDATQSDLILGLVLTDTTPLDATDGIYFIKADGAATISIICRTNATTGSNTAVVATLADATYYTAGWFYDGIDRLYYGLGANLACPVLGFISASATFLPDALLTPTFGVQNGEAVAKTLLLDYLFAAKER